VQLWGKIEGPCAIFGDKEFMDVKAMKENQSARNKNDQREPVMEKWVVRKAFERYVARKRCLETKRSKIFRMGLVIAG